MKFNLRVNIYLVIVCFSYSMKAVLYQCIAAG